jgi:hypothetical protein
MPEIGRRSWTRRVRQVRWTAVHCSSLNQNSAPLIPSAAPTRCRGPAGHRVVSARSEVSHRPRGTVPGSPLIFVTVAND